MSFFQNSTKSTNRKQQKQLDDIQSNLSQMRELINQSNTNVVILRKDQTDDTLVSNLTVITSNIIVGNNGTYMLCIIDAINLMLDLGFRLERMNVNVKDNFGMSNQKEYLFIRYR